MIVKNTTAVPTAHQEARKLIEYINSKRSTTAINRITFCSVYAHHLLDFKKGDLLELNIGQYDPDFTFEKNSVHSDRVSEEFNKVPTDLANKFFLAYLLNLWASGLTDVVKKAKAPSLITESLPYALTMYPSGILFLGELSYLRGTSKYTGRCYYNKIKWYFTIDYLNFAQFSLNQASKDLDKLICNFTIRDANDDNPFTKLDLQIPLADLKPAEVYNMAVDMAYKLQQHYKL